MDVRRHRSLDTYVRDIACEYRHTPAGLLDLIQQRNVGLMHAVRKDDPERNVKLSTCAVWWIRAYISNYVRENWHLTRVGERARQLETRLKDRRRQRLQGSNGLTLSSRFGQSPRLGPGGMC